MQVRQLLQSVAQTEGPAAARRLLTSLGDALRAAAVRPEQFGLVEELSDKRAAVRGQPYSLVRQLWLHDGRYRIRYTTSSTAFVVVEVALMPTPYGK